MMRSPEEQSQNTGKYKSTAMGRVLTDLCGSLHLEHLDTLDQGGARIVNAVEHRLATKSQRVRETWTRTNNRPLAGSCLRRIVQLFLQALQLPERDG